MVQFRQEDKTKAEDKNTRPKRKLDSDSYTDNQEEKTKRRKTEKDPNNSYETDFKLNIRRSSTPIPENLSTRKRKRDSNEFEAAQLSSVLED